MDVENRLVILLSPPDKRKLGRIIAWVAAVWLVLAVIGTVTSYQKRKAAGYRPLPPASVVTMVAPVGMLLVGCWIGYGQVVIDRRAGTVVRKTLGPVFPGRVFDLAGAKQLHVGYFHGPSNVTPQSYAVRKRPVFWFVRLEGEEAGVMLVRQRTRAEAITEAERFAAFLHLPVRVDDPPRSA